MNGVGVRVRRYTEKLSVLHQYFSTKASVDKS